MSECPKCDGEGVTWEQSVSYGEDGEKHYERELEEVPCACQPERPTSVVEWRDADSDPPPHRDPSMRWIVVCDDGSVKLAEHGHGKWTDVEWWDVLEVTHYAPLPTPPPKREG